MGSGGCPWAGSKGEKLSNIPFLVTYHRLCLLVGNHFAPSLLLLLKMLSLAAVAMISVKRKSLQAISTLFSQCLPKNSTFGHFWLFFTICACSWATPWSHLCYYWQKISLGAVEKYIQTKSYFKLLSTYFPTICLRIPFFDRFWPFFTIFACLWTSFLPHLCLYWQKDFQWELLQWYL